MKTSRLNINDIRAYKNGKKIAVLTAYDYHSARLLDSEVDILLVGDSLGMVVYGFGSTLPVTLEMMASHARAVVAGSSKSLVVVDMPFGSYQQSPAQAFKNAAKLITASGAQAVKIEGGAEMAATVKFLTERGIAVMGHIGLQPQSFNAYGGYKVQGKSKKAAAKLLYDAQELEQASCFAIVIEAVPEKLAAKITAAIAIPTIGIGASQKCDGQVLVLHDILGLTENPAKFVKTYADLNKIISQAAKDYTADIKSGKFPSKDNYY